MQTQPADFKPRAASRPPSMRISRRFQDEENYWLAPQHGYDDLYAECPDSSEVVRRLFARFNDVALQAAHKADTAAKVLVGALAGVYLGKGIIPGKDWLTDYYARRCSTTNSGISVHPYQYTDSVFNPDIFSRDLSTIRSIMQQHGEDDKPLMATELSYNGAGRVGDALWRSARWASISMPESHLMALAGDPVGFYNRIFHYKMFTAANPYNDSVWAASLFCWDPADTAVVDTMPCYYAYRQMTSQLRGKRLNGRFLSGDTGRDNHTFLYELEDPASRMKSWVGWRNYYDPLGSVSVRVPSRSNTDDKVTLARDGSPDSVQLSTSSSGWRTVTLDSMPVYIHERDTALRPDLVVDSLWTKPDTPAVWRSCTLYARFKNQGTAQTPDSGDATDGQYPILRFFVNDGPAGTGTTTLFGLSVGGSRTTKGSVVWTPHHQGPYLLKASITPHVIMETCFDNNSKYRLYSVSLPTNTRICINPGTQTSGITCTNAPRIILQSLSFGSGLGLSDSMQLSVTHWPSLADSWRSVLQSLQAIQTEPQTAVFVAH